MTHADFARWLDAYIDAWMTYDPAAIGALFSEDAEYRYRPTDEPLHGRDAIVADWLENRDVAGTYEAEYVPWAIEGSRAVATGTSRYSAPDDRRVFSNVFLCEFDADGLCRSFTEVFVLER